MINGIINIHKEKGFTSHDVVAKLRGILRQKKIGHTGTLDPDATGVLPVCLGKATRVCEFLTDETKTYEAVLLLGKTTDTQDTSGTTLEEKVVNCTEEELLEVLKSFEGVQMQVPPMYSALKVNGKKLYELAREGKIVERKARPVHFYSITMLSCALPEAKIRIVCSKGTYIRTLCNDIGERLGCGGCMKELIRTRVGNCRLEDAWHLDEIRELADRWREEEESRDFRTPVPEELLTDAGMLTPVDRIFSDLPELVLPQAADALAHNGNRIPWKLTGAADVEAEEVRVYDSQKRFVGVFRRMEKNRDWKPEKMFYDPEA
ncbi:MAG: tRNA pseudouridine(55) synthase TruB [Eubacteriales bacterium]|nr:tRNA pseudouridine(55) synthase TruB [Eubacteriales bacterium]